MRAIYPRTAWHAVLERDRCHDGQFVYAVASTRVYCRPSCPSRRPSRKHVRFFPSPHQAEAAGFRACLRCRPASSNGTETEQRAARARRYMDDHHAGAPLTLSQVAGAVGLSPGSLRRAFIRLVGMSPKAYSSGRRMIRFKTALRQGAQVTDAVYEAGFGSSSRVYERVAGALGMTPRAFRTGGAGVIIRHTTVRTPIGLMLVAATERGLVTVSLGDSARPLIAALRQDFPNATLCRDGRRLQPHVAAVLRCLKAVPRSGSLALDVHGTAFQWSVWKALQRIPRGETRSYREIARSLGCPSAARAVARACATNPVAIAIPCHRTIRSDGSLAGYRWGLRRKQRLLDLEQKPEQAR